MMDFHSSSPSIRWTTFFESRYNARSTYMFTDAIASIADLVR